MDTIVFRCQNCPHYYS